jgi:hypothetical protein
MRNKVVKRSYAFDNAAVDAVGVADTRLNALFSNK